MPELCHATRCAMVIAVLAACGIASSAAVADPSAHFELRLAPGQDDAVLVLGDPTDNILNLELWVELFDAPMPLWSFSVYLRTTHNGTITFNEDFDGIPFTFNCPYNGTSNTPFSGDFSPACFQPGGITGGLGAPTLLGTFSVSGVAPGTVSYFFDDSEPVDRPLIVTLVGTTEIEDDDLTTSIDPRIATIQVVDFVPSADADDDNDVDLADFAMFQRCASVNPGPGPAACATLDLNMDGVVNAGDTQKFVTAVTGLLKPGDMNLDGDVDLADFARFQICLAKGTQPGFEATCLYADVDHDGAIDGADYTRFAESFAGPR